MTVLVDSDILIEVFRAKDATIGSKWMALSQSSGRILCSAVSVAEIWAGARVAEHQGIDRLFRALNCVSIDAEIAERAGEYLRVYKKSDGLDLGDALIAATAVHHNAALWTRNLKHYPMPGLKFF